MNLQTITPKNKTVFIEVIVLILFLGGMYYLYTQFSSPSVTVSTTDVNQSLLGANSLLFIQAMNQDKISFKDLSFLDSELVKELQDFSENIATSTSRGRSNPFTSYASPRPTR